jgi:hypothetical protein
MIWSYHRGMKHIPQRHQSIAPPRAFVLTIVAIVVLMAIIYVVVALASVS